MVSTECPNCHATFEDETKENYGIMTAQLMKWSIRHDIAINEIMTVLEQCVDHTGTFRLLDRDFSEFRRKYLALLMPEKPEEDVK